MKTFSIFVIGAIIGLAVYKYQDVYGFNLPKADVSLPSHK